MTALGCGLAGLPGESLRLALAIGQHRDTDTRTEHLELIDGGGTLQVRRHQQRALALRLEPLRQLGGGGGLA